MSEVVPPRLPHTRHHVYPCLTEKLLEQNCRFAQYNYTSYPYALDVGGAGVSPAWQASLCSFNLWY